MALAMRFEAEPRLGALLQQLDSKAYPGLPQDDNKERAINGKVRCKLPSALSKAATHRCSDVLDASCMLIYGLRCHQLHLSGSCTLTALMTAGGGCRW